MNADQKTTAIPPPLRVVPLMMGLMAASMPVAFSADNPPLARTAGTLAETRKLTIGYLGGSLTNGTGASKADELSWRAKTTQWFQERFPEAEITGINAAIGGTGSDLGVYRVAGDMLVHKPDLVFVEFAVNDSGRGKDRVDSVTSAMEGIVRQIWNANSRADIVFVYTTMKANEEYHLAGVPAPSVVRHQRVADHYGIPSVDIGGELWNQMRQSGKSWADLMPDNVHPNDVGYAIYSRGMEKFLEDQDWRKTSHAPVVMAEPLVPNAPVNPRFVDATEHANEQWKVTEIKVGRFTRAITSETPGAELKFQFRGTAIGIYWLSADDAGSVEWSLDGSPFETRHSWSPHGGKNGRPYSAMFSDPIWGKGLPPGEHELILRVAPKSDSRSEGNRVRIAAFIVNEPPE